MSWDQSTSRASVEGFLLGLLGINLDDLVLGAIKEGLEKKGLTFEVTTDESKEAGDGLMTVFHPQVITLSDGRVFEEAITETDRWDDEGHDHYGFVERGKPYEIEHREHGWTGDGEFTQTRTETISPRLASKIENEEVIPLEELRAEGGAMGEAIADMMGGLGIESIQWASDDEDDDSGSVGC